MEGLKKSFLVRGNNIVGFSDKNFSTAPIGTVLSFAGQTAPNGYLLCDGASYAVADYPDLYAVIGNTYGGDTENFNVPNLVDKFIEGSTTSGTEKEAGLPNIEGSFALVRNDVGSIDGVFSSIPPTHIGIGGNGGTTCGVDFNASRSSAIYGKSNTVQPPALTMVYVIKAFHTNEGVDSGVSDDVINYIKSEITEFKTELKENINHNTPRLVPKDITSYYTDGTLWDRLEGTNGFSLFEDIFVGDYIKMSRPISAYNQNQTYQETGSQYVTIAGIDTLWGNGDTISMDYHHLVMVPGQGFDGTQHFGKSRMNPTDTTENGYVGSEMHTTTIGAVVTAGSTETTATINQQLYAEFGSHLKTTRELLSKSIESTGYNRLGSNTGCSRYCTWTNCQAVLMSEIEVHGSIVFSSSGYDTGNANKQLPLFVNSKQAINDRSALYWLKDIASNTTFCYCCNDGKANIYIASGANNYVRPRFVIAK